MTNIWKQTIQYNSTRYSAKNVLGFTDNFSEFVAQQKVTMEEIESRNAAHANQHVEMVDKIKSEVDDIRAEMEEIRSSTSKKIQTLQGIICYIIYSVFPNVSDPFETGF